ncbi:MAG TPA: FAD-dependent oxidoreductase, partial [Solirubrobacteraceae bacterium]
PFGRNRDGVAGNLVEPRQTEYAFTSGRRVLVPRSPDAAPGASTMLAWLDDFCSAAGIPAAERAHFVNRILVFLTSSEERRLGQWDAMSWKDFIVRAGGASFSDAYTRVLGEALVRGAIAVSGRSASARTVGRILEAFAYTGMPAVSGYGAPDRILDAPTNEAWIDPWVALLRRRGVRFVRFRAVRALEIRRGRVTAAVLTDSGARLEADWFVCAVPVERARPLLSRDVLALDPSLEGMRRLRTEWMNGIQFFLRRRFREPTVGHTLHVDSPWALSSINQARFWPHRRLPRDYGDGRVREILSAIISDWTTPSPRVGQPASRCTADQIARETWRQLKADLGRPGELTDDMLVDWSLDRAIGAPEVPGRRATNDSPLFANTVGAWTHRPSPATAIPNLLLASDYVRTEVDLATMEGANESARRAVNALLERSGSRARPATVFELYRPTEYEEARRTDAERFRHGLPHAMEAAVPQPA